MENSFFESGDLIARSRTWASINLTNLKYNLVQIKTLLPDKTKIMAVVKADAYGHGDIRVAQVMLENGIDFLAVSNIDEALSLRKNKTLANFDYKILILGYTPINLANILVKFDIQQTIISFEYAKLLEEHCSQNNLKVKTHIKIDTGMSRLGIDSDNYNDIISIYQFENIQVEGIYSHLSSADGVDDASFEYTKLQQNKFDDLITKISDYNGSAVTHLQNSAGAVTISNEYDYARIGLLLYGITPMKTNAIELKPVMSLKSVVAMVKEIDTDIAVSYGRHFKSNTKMQIATIPIGYADGYSRALSNKGQVLINGEFAPIVGNVCMDQIIVDVTNINVVMGDIVTLVGQDGDNTIHFDDIATLVDTIAYELVCLIGKRVPRESMNY